MIINCLDGKPLPIYGHGKNVRDWLYVEDHADALIAVSERAMPGATYNIGGNAERQNIEVVNALCESVDRHVPSSTSRKALITYVKDRPGHDARYAIDASKIKTDLSWEPKVTFEEGLELTVEWYLENQPWWREILAQKYDGARLGTV